MVPNETAIATQAPSQQPGSEASGVQAETPPTSSDHLALVPTPEKQSVSKGGASKSSGGAWLTFTSYARLTLGAAVMWMGVVAFVPILLCFLPSRSVRIRASNIFGSLFGRFMFWCSGSKMTTEGYEDALARGPAIWAMNHCSLLDIPLGIWLSPSGTVGVGKKQVILYPFFGQLYVLAGHLRIDRSSIKAAIKSMQRMGEWVRKDKLSIFIWPEGTRSPDGRMRAFKKGIVHLAIQTGLPIQPMATSGTQIAWAKGPPKVIPTSVTINFPAPIDTKGWKVETIEDHLKEIEAMFIDVLPAEQKPLEPLR